MSHTGRTRVVLALAGLAVAGIALAWWLAPRPQQPPPGGPDFGNPAGGFVLDLATDRLPDAVTLDGRSVTRFGLGITSIGIDGGRAILSLEEDGPRFNDYGDAPAARAPVTLPVTLRKSDAWYDRSEGTLYEVVADDGRFANRLRLLRTPDPGVTHTLIVRTMPEPEYAVGPERILELRDASRAFARGGPVPEKFDFYTLIRSEYDAGEGNRRWRFQEVRVRGPLAAGGELHIDRNYIHFSPTGKVGGGTAAYNPPVQVTFRELGPDPAGKGRRAFALEPAVIEGRSYVLVLAADHHGPHRLVVKQDGAVRQLLPLVPYDPEYPAPTPAMLATLPEAERAAVVRLRDRYGKNARFYANDGHVWYAVLLDADDDALPDLRELKGLRLLQAWGERMTDEGLRTLGALTQLQELTVHAGRATDAGLVHLETLQGLDHINVYPKPVSKEVIDALRAKLPKLRPWPRTPAP
jgi:hypothetical protein